MVTVLGLIGAALAGPALLLGGAFPGFGTLHGPSVPEPVTAAVAQANPAPETGGRAWFNDPSGARSDQFSLVRRIDRSIDSAAAGSTVRLAAYSFAMPSTAEALLSAHQRGVRVQVVVDDHSAHWGPVRRLSEALGRDTSADEFVKVCRLSCRGGRGNQHAKFLTVSSGSMGEDLVMVGSLNLTGFSSQRQWNDLYVANDPDAHRQLARVFALMADDHPQSRLVLHETAKGFATDLAPYPAGDGGGDPVARRLARVRCHGTSLLSGRDGRTVLRISMHAWNGDRGVALARQVARLHRRGCDVKVLYGVGMGRAVATVLRSSGVPVRDSNNGGRRVHHKVMVLSGVLGDQIDANYVWTGSHNWSDRSLRNDEIMLRVSGRHLVQEYLANFRKIWRAANGG